MDSFPAFSTSPSVVSSVLQGMNNRGGANVRMLGSNTGNVSGNISSNVSMTPHQGSGLFTTGSVSNSAFDVFSTNTSNNGFPNADFASTANTFTTTNNNINNNNNNNSFVDTVNNTSMVISNTSNIAANINANNNNSMGNVGAVGLGQSTSNSSSNNNNNNGNDNNNITSNNTFGAFSNFNGMNGNNATNNNNNTTTTSTTGINNSNNNNISNNSNTISSSPLLLRTPMMFSTSANVNNFTTVDASSPSSNANNLVSGIGNHMGSNFSNTTANGSNNIMGGNNGVGISNTSMFSTTTTNTTTTNNSNSNNNNNNNTANLTPSSMCSINNNNNNNNNTGLINNNQVNLGLNNSVNATPNTFSTNVNNFSTSNSKNNNVNGSVSMNSFHNSNRQYNNSNNNNNNNNNNIPFVTRMPYSAMPSSVVSPPSFSTSAFPHLPPSSMISAASPGPGAMIGANSNINATSSPPHQMPRNGSLATTSSSSTTPNPILPVGNNNSNSTPMLDTGRNAPPTTATGALPLLDSARIHSDNMLGAYNENYTSPIQPQTPSMFTFPLSQQSNINNNNSTRFDFGIDNRNQGNNYNMFGDGLVMGNNNMNMNLNKYTTTTTNNNNNNSSSSNNTFTNMNFNNRSSINNNNNAVSQIMNNGSNYNNNFGYQFNANVPTNQTLTNDNTNNNNNNGNSNNNTNNINFTITNNNGNNSNINNFITNDSMITKQELTPNNYNNSKDNSNNTINKSMKAINGEIDAGCQDVSNLPNTDDTGVLKYANKHLTSTFDIGANDLQSLEQLKEMIMALQDVAEGKVRVDWAEIVHFDNIQESANAICSALTSVESSELREAYEAIAHLLKSPEHISLLVALEERHRVAIRNVVLQHLFNKLLLVSNSTPRPVCAEMLVKMAQLNLVRLQGIAATVHQLLPKPDKQRAGIAVLGRVAEQFQRSEPFLQMLRSEPVVLETLCQLAMQPEFEYDVIAICKLLHCEQELKVMLNRENGWENDNGLLDRNSNVNSKNAGSINYNSGISSGNKNNNESENNHEYNSTRSGEGNNNNSNNNKSNSSSSSSCVGNELLLFSTFVHKVEFPAPALSLDYMTGLDELVSCHANGDIVMWGDPTITSYNVNNNENGESTNNRNNDNNNSTNVTFVLRPDDVFAIENGDDSNVNDKQYSLELEKGYNTRMPICVDKTGYYGNKVRAGHIRHIPILLSAAPGNSNYFVSTHAPMNEEGPVHVAQSKLKEQITVIGGNNNNNSSGCAVNANTVISTSVGRNSCSSQISKSTISQSQPFFCIHRYNEERASSSAPSWSRKFVARSSDSIITALTTWESSLFCSAEYGRKSNGDRSHQLHFYSAESGNELRCIEDVHNDYVTVLSRCDDSEHVLISGGRDAIVKLWDCRSRSSAAQSNLMFTAPQISSFSSSPSTCNLPSESGYRTNDNITNKEMAIINDSAESSLLYKLDGATHVDTISSIHSFRSWYICTASLDGSMQMWDTRNLSLPVCTRRFDAPVLDMTTLIQNRITNSSFQEEYLEKQQQQIGNSQSTHLLVSTARGLYLLDANTLIARDVIPNVAFNQLKVNKNGNVLFANDGATGVINMFTFRKV